MRCFEVKIIDDDVDFKSLLPDNIENTLEEDVGDNEPTIVEVIDERPEHIKQLEEYRNDDKWKLLGKDKDEYPSPQYGVIGSQKRSRHDSDRDSSPRGHGEYDSDSDISFDRQRSSGKSPSKHQDSDSDQSPPRKSHKRSLLQRRQRHDSELDQSLPRKKRHDSDSDQSPPRMKGQNFNSDQSPLRRKRHDSDSDQSPPRNRGHNSDSNQSPPRRKRHDSFSDQSPPRRKRHDSNSDQSPPRRKRHDSNSDQSPPRRKRHDSDSDQSPPRRKQHKSDYGQSPHVQKHKKTISGRTRKSRFGDIESDNFPSHENVKHRKKLLPSENDDRNSDHDQSPPRRQTGVPADAGAQKKGSQGSRVFRKEVQYSGDSKSVKATKTLSGAKAGLSSAYDMREESEKIKQREQDIFNKIDEKTLGRNAATVFRDKSGRKRNFEEEKLEQEEENQKKAEDDKKYVEWGKGLKQGEDHRKMLEDTIHEMSKPLARYRDDEDLDNMLKNLEREGDPMAAFLKKKKKDPNKKEKPRYKGPAPPPNRFGILPGYRWDGVNRSSGFEAQLFAKIAEKKALRDMAYKWSTEDM